MIRNIEAGMNDLTKLKTGRAGVVTTLLMCVLAGNAHAFVSGSTGVDGALEVADGTTQTVTLPPDGVLHYTTVHVGRNAKLYFAANADNTPVVILASGDVTVDATGLIDISGKPGADAGAAGDGKTADDGTPGQGGPGGYSGGAGGDPNGALKLYYSTGTYVRGGAGLGPGWGMGGSYILGSGAAGGSYGTASIGVSYTSANAAPNGGGVYGSPTVLPLLGGSGGGGGFSRITAAGYKNFGGAGGGGGGAILIASSGRIAVNGEIRANGGKGGAAISSYGSNFCVASGGGGSGGAVRLMATEIVGSGTVKATGGPGGTAAQPNSICGGYAWIGTAGGAGRILFEADTPAVLPTATPTAVVSTTPPTSTYITGLPRVRISKVHTSEIPDAPATDLHIQNAVANPVLVTIVTQDVPVGATVTLYAIPKYGEVKKIVSPAIAPDENGRAEITLSIDIDLGYNALIATSLN